MPIEVNIYDEEELLEKEIGRDRVIDFLYTHLDQYGDAKKDISACLDYVFDPDRGGLVLLAIENNKILGACVINHTGMSGYIPEHILVYIAVDQAARGKGIGKKIMKAAIGGTKGNIALHVEPDNPARYLYEKLGFTNKYLEMRLNKS